MYVQIDPCYPQGFQNTYGYQNVWIFKPMDLSHPHLPNLEGFLKAREATYFCMPYLRPLKCLFRVKNGIFCFLGGTVMRCLTLHLKRYINNPRSPKWQWDSTLTFIFFFKIVLLFNHFPFSFNPCFQELDWNFSHVTKRGQMNDCRNLNVHKVQRNGLEPPRHIMKLNLSLDVLFLASNVCCSQLWF